VDADKVCTECLKEMFRRVGMQYPNKKFTDNPNWFRMRCWTKKEEEDFEMWMRAYLKKTCRWSTRMINKEVGMFMLIWGWKVNTEAL